jgi:hypothetical protein
MTDPEALPDEDLSAWPINDDADEDFDWDWDAPPVDREPEPSRPAWYRSPGPLLALISGAAATLVVAVALVITDSGEIPTRPALGTKAVSTGAPSPSRAAPTADAPESSPSVPSSAEESNAEEEPPAAVAVVRAAEPAAPPAAPPPAALPVDSPGAVEGSNAAGSNSDGPRINVTRSPMSFTPGSSAGG